MSPAAETGDQWGFGVEAMSGKYNIFMAPRLLDLLTFYSLLAASVWAPIILVFPSLSPLLPHYNFLFSTVSLSLSSARTLHQTDDELIIKHKSIKVSYQQ